MRTEAMLRQLFITTKFFDKCLKAFIFCLPIIWLPGIQQSNLQLLLFNYGTLILFGLSIFLPAKREFSNHNILLIFTVSIILSLIRNPLILSISFLNIIIGCLLYYTIVRSVDDIKNIVNIFVWLASLNIIMAITQIANLHLLYKEDVVCGLMAHKNHLAMFLALVSPILLKRSWLFIPLVFILLVYLQCYSALLGFLVGLAIWLYFRNIKWQEKIIISSITIFIAIFILMSIFSSNFPAYKITSRFPVWEIILKESFSNPFIGKGIDSFKALSNILSSSGVDVINSYSEYMRLIFEFGIFAVILIGISLFRYYKKLFIKDNQICQTLLASIASFLIIMGFQDPLHIVRLAIPFVVILGCLEANCIDNRKEIKNVD